MDTTHVSMIQVQINSVFFGERYRCDKNVTLGLAHSSVDKILKTIEDGWKLTLCCDVDTQEYLDFHAESQPYGVKVVQYRLKLLEVKEQPMDIPEDQIADSVVLQMTSKEYKNCCNDLKNLQAERVELKYTKEGLSWGYQTEVSAGSILCTAWTSQNKTKDPHLNNGVALDSKVEEDPKLQPVAPKKDLFSFFKRKHPEMDTPKQMSLPSDKTTSKKQKTDSHYGVYVVSFKEEVEAMEFSLLHLQYFTSACGICEKMTLSLTTGIPLCITLPLFDTGNLQQGHVRFFLAPKIKD